MSELLATILFLASLLLLVSMLMLLLASPLLLASLLLRVSLLLLLTSLMFLFPIVSAAVYPSVAIVLVASSCGCCWRPCSMLMVSLLLLTFLLSDSGGPAAVDIYDVPIVPVAAVILDVNSVPDVVGLPAFFCNLCCSWPPYKIALPSCLIKQKPRRGGGLRKMTPAAKSLYRSIFF
jgi:hypothetical protein